MAKGVFPKNMNYRVDPEDYSLIEEIAKNMGITISSLMRMLIKERLREVTKDGQFRPEKFLK